MHRGVAKVPLPMTKQEIRDLTAKLCGFLTELGYQYHFEADNRSSSKSCYIFVRSRRYMEIRISDHPMRKRRRRQTYDIGPHGVALDQAMKEIAEYHEAAKFSGGKNGDGRGRTESTSRAQG